MTTWLPRTRLGPLRAQARRHIGNRLDPTCLHVLLPERQDLQQGQGLLRLLEGRNVLQHGFGFPVLRDDQGLPVFGQVDEHLGGIGLEVADGLDLG